eukprot:9060303-Alexandrium_andersonii.AAC.1
MGQSSPLGRALPPWLGRLAGTTSVDAVRAPDPPSVCEDELEPPAEESMPTSIPPATGTVAAGGA